MKKYFHFLLALAMLISFSACDSGTQSAANPGETPLGVQYRLEKGYLSYTNDNFMFRIDYPDIFTEKQEADDGILLTSEECELRAWGKENTADLTVEEAYRDAISRYTGVTNDVCGKSYYAFEFTEGESRGFCYSMYAENVFYTFRFIYPEEKKDEFEAYCVDMATTFVVTGTYVKD